MPSAGTDGLAVCEATSPADVVAAQRLRYRVFVEEMGAQLPNCGEGIEADRFDAHCTHLLVRRGSAGPVVGTYRLLSAHGARSAGGFICEELFDLAPLGRLRDEAVELGRACVDPAWRGSAVLMLLWSGIARHLVAHGKRYLFGCASLERRDGGAAAAHACAHLASAHAAPAQFLVAPRVPVPPATGKPASASRLSPVLKGYLQAGAWVCGEPAWDRRFDTADLFVLFDAAQSAPRYARRFLDGAAAGAPMQKTA